MTATQKTKMLSPTTLDPNTIYQGLTGSVRTGFRGANLDSSKLPPPKPKREVKDVHQNKLLNVEFQKILNEFLL